MRVGAASMTVSMMVWMVAGNAAYATAQEAPRLTREQILERIAALEVELATLKVAVQQNVDGAGAPLAQQAPQTRPAPPAQLGPPAQQAPQTVPEAQESTDALHALKFGVGLDTYYGFNFNRPIGRVNLLRAYDVLSNNFSLNQASLVLDSPADVKAGRRFGGRLDFQYGQATETLQGSLANEPRPWVYRNVFQAYGTFVAPLGSGLTIDFGKWASSLGYESNYTKDQINYSRSFWFNFLPFYHMGGRLHYQFSDAVGLNYWITNGTQQTEAFNNFKDQFVGVALQPSKSVTWNINYYLGQEHPDVQIESQPGSPTLPTQPGLSITPVVPYFTGKLQIFDSYVSWQPTPATTTALEGDYVTNQNPSPAAASWTSGGAAYFRRQLTARTALGLRAEFLVDHGGLFTGQTQRIGEATATYDVRVGDGFLIRSEYRHDHASMPFFLTSTVDVHKKSQDTATLGLVWWFGTKREAW
jgi:hypothetical protein